jgi:HEPN domain-containing protein
MERSADWFEQAESDMAHARNDLQSGFYDWACFTSQQSAEKAVKSVFFKMGAETWSHSVADLLEELSRTTDVRIELKEAALELDKAYVAARYPNAHPAGAPRNRYSLTEAERFVSHGEKILEFCKDRLSAL